jgi:PAS domain S-box-containing protein
MSRKSRETLDNSTPGLGEDYQRRTQTRIETLLPILAQAAEGDFSLDVPLVASKDEFSELYIGFQRMLEVVREKLGQLEQLNIELEEIVAARSNELYGSETRYTAVADMANDAIVTIDSHGAITYMNRAAELIFGRPILAASGKPLSLLIPGLDPKYLETLQASPITGSKKLRKLVEATAKYKGGREFPVELSFAAWQVGTNIFNTAIIRDLTVHQMLVDKLAQRTSELESKVSGQTKLLRLQLAKAEQDQAEDEALLGSIGEGVVAMNKAGRIFFVNREFARLTGASVDQIKSRRYYSGLKLVDENGRPVHRSLRPIYRTLQTGLRSFNNDYYYQSADGRLFPVAITAAPIVVKGKIIGVIDVIRDITKEKAADHMKSDFVSLASHQLRTPATAIKGLISLLIEGYSGELTTDQMSLLRQAFIENEHELALVDDMLDVVKFDTGKVILEKTDVDIVKMVKDVVAEQQVLIQSRHQAVIVSSPRPVIVWADSGKLQMVFENIITNASKYTPENGRISVGMSVSDKVAVINIKDNGIGIASTDIDLLFKRFSRAANAAKMHTSGSGLGLYLAKKIVDLHQGQITVASKLGHGSTFTVTLPTQIKE